MATELTADRFELLATRDLAASLRLDMISVAGLDSALQWDTDAYLVESRALVDALLADGDTVIGTSHPEHSARAWAAWLFSETDVYRDLTGYGPAARSLGDVDALLSRLLGAEHDAPADLRPGRPPAATLDTTVRDDPPPRTPSLERVAAEVLAERAFRALEGAAKRAANVADEVERTAVSVLSRLTGHPARTRARATLRPPPDPLEQDRQDLEARFEKLEREAREKGG